MRDLDLPPRVDDDPYNRAGGARSVFSQQQEVREWDELVEEHGLGCWDCEQVRRWLRDAR